MASNPEDYDDELLLQIFNAINKDGSGAICKQDMIDFFSTLMRLKRVVYKKMDEFLRQKFRK